MTNNIDNLFLAMNENINHSNYEANVTIEINKYISEKQSGVINIIAGAKGGETHLLISPTGSGKSYTIINLLKDFNVKSLFILPNSANVEQAMKEYNIYGAFGDLSAKEAIKKGDVIVMTWDKVSQLTDIDLSEYVIIIDEIHQTYTDTYRNKAIKGLYEVSNRCKGRIDITATPNKLDFNIYNYITEYKQLEQTNYNVKLYNDIDTKTIINILNNSKNSALLMNDIKELKYISNSINKKNDVIYSDMKEHSQLYENIMNKSHMGDFKALLNTTTIVAGVNIKNPNITDIVVVGIKDIGAIKQYVARFRDLKECNVHIFNKYEDECNIYNVEWLVNKNIKDATKLKDFYNEACNGNTEFSTLGYNINPINLDTNIYFNKETNSYEVDTVYIRSQVYKKYYNKRTIESFKVILNEYFENIELISELEIDEDIVADKNQFKADIKEAKKDAIEILDKYKYILVGYEDIKKGKRNSKLEEYQNINGLSMDQVQKDYFKYGIHNLILNNSLKSMINLYTKYVLENSFSTDIAWKLANMGNRKRGSIFAKMNTLIYKELKEDYPNAFANDYSIEVRIYEWLINEFKIGIAYTSEHLEILAEAFKMTFGDNWALTPKKLGEILNQIYKIDSTQTRIGTVVETLFYRNIIPTGVASKKIRIYEIKSRIELLDIKKELAVTSSDKSLDFSIQRRKSKILNQLDKNVKEILLEGVF
ncbi:MAG: DEAD/DEAH box helicase family protein [Paeniclostridium sp.]